MQPGEIYEKLAEGDRKAVARSGEVARAAIAAPELLPHIIDLLSADNTAVVSHAAHALMTVSKHGTALLEPHRSELVGALSSTQWEVQEQISKILPHLSLDAAEKLSVFNRFYDIFYHEKSSIARTCALQAMVDMGEHFDTCRDKVRDVLVFAMENGTKAMQARARNILKQYHWVASAT